MPGKGRLTSVGEIRPGGRQETYFQWADIGHKENTPERSHRGESIAKVRIHLENL